MHLTVEEFKSILPAQVRKNVSTDVMDIVNNVIGEPEYIETFRDNLVGFQSILSQGKYKLTNYVEAVKYVSHKLLGSKNNEAYKKAFPEKVAAMRARGLTEVDISRFVHQFNNSKLVSSIFAQSMIPTHILNADVFQEAINIQLELARSASSEKVRSDAANSLMVQLRPPETKKIELDIGMKEDSSINALRETTMELVRETRLALEARALTAQQVAHRVLIVDAEYTS